MLADQKVAQLVSSPEDIPPEDSGDFGEDFPGYSWRSVMSDIESELLEDTARRLKRLDIYIDAVDQGGGYHLCTHFLFDTEL
jgi:general secretion pathway protein I